MTDTIFPDALEILRATSDGDDLDPQHLKLVEMAVNNQLNENGRAAFAELLARVRAGYVKPCLHGVEHITRDHAGYIYWKTHRIEHFSSAYALSPDAAAYARRLAEACQTLEARGITPSFAAICRVEAP